MDRKVELACKPDLPVGLLIMTSSAVAIHCSEMPELLILVDCLP